jgi:hypothetical protein
VSHHEISDGSCLLSREAVFEQFKVTVEVVIRQLGLARYLELLHQQVLCVSHCWGYVHHFPGQARAASGRSYRTDCAPRTEMGRRNMQDGGWAWQSATRTNRLTSVVSRCVVTNGLTTVPAEVPSTAPGWAAHSTELNASRVALAAGWV